MFRLLPTLLLAAAPLVAGTAWSLDDVTLPPAPSVDAKAWILVDHNTGQVLASHAENERLDPASITKLMTAYAVFRSLRDGAISLADEVTISETAWRRGGAASGGSTTFLDLGSRVPVEALIQGMIVQSGNDASIALAEHVAGTEEAFAMVMDRYAQELGMTNTSYRNSTGLPDADHYTTAADIAKLASAIIREFPQYYRWYSQRDFTWNGITQPNRNRLLWRDPAVDGMKTGYTEAAGYCLVSSAKRDDMRLVAVVLGAQSPRDRERESHALLNHGFRFWETRLLAEAGKPLSEVRVWKGAQSLVGIGATTDLWATVPRGSAELEPEIDLPSQILAPLDPSVAIGTLRIRSGERVLREAGLHPLAAVPEGPLWSQAWDSLMLWLE